MNQISALNNPKRVDMPLNKLNQIVMTIIHHLQMNQISALNYPKRVDIPLNKKLNQTFRSEFNFNIK